MLLFDDDDQLPAAADEGEVALAARLGTAGLQAVDAALTGHVRHHWLKVARVVIDALKAGGFSTSDEASVRLHVRRVRGLVESGVLAAQGNLYRPRWSEVRLPDTT